MKVPYFFVLLIAMSLTCSSAVADTAKSLHSLNKQYEVSTCIQCHPENGHDWAESQHAKSLADPEIVKSFRTYIFENNETSRQTERIQILAECLSCHAPQAADAPTGTLEHILELIVAAVEYSDRNERKNAIETLSTLNVNCRVCHMMKGMPLDSVSPGTIYGPGWDEDELSHKSEYGFETVGSEYLTSSRVCISCHKGGDRESLSSSYLQFHSRILQHYEEHRSDRTCQHCHMQGNGTLTHNFQHKQS